MKNTIKLNGITYTYNATEKQQYIIEMLEDKEYFSSKYWIVRDITLTVIKRRIKLGQAPFKTINEKDIKRAIEIVENAISKHEEQQQEREKHMQRYDVTIGTLNDEGLIDEVIYTRYCDMRDYSDLNHIMDEFASVSKLYYHIDKVDEPIEEVEEVEDEDESIDFLKTRREIMTRLARSPQGGWIHINKQWTFHWKEMNDGRIFLKVRYCDLPMGQRLVPATFEATHKAVSGLISIID